MLYGFQLFSGNVQPEGNEGTTAFRAVVGEVWRQWETAVEK